MTGAAAVTMIASKGASSGPARRAVAVPVADVRVAQPVENGAGLPGERFDDLDRPDLAGELGQDGGLVARPGADLEDLFPAPKAERLRHIGDDVGLGDGLAVADGQGLVGVGMDPQAFGDEEVARDLGHRGQHARIADPPGADLGIRHQPPFPGAVAVHRGASPFQYERAK